MDTIVLYSGSLCNLQCRYCYIDKNIALKEIDEELQKSFEDENYYFDFAKRFFGSAADMKSIEIWGAETMISMHRIIPTYKKLLSHYTNLNNFFTSTNFCSNNLMEELFGLLNVYRLFPERKFAVTLQISIDGDKDINDASRGIGVTDKIINNFNVFLSRIYDIPENVEVTIALKQTLDICSWNNFLDKEYIKKYFLFFEDNFIKKVKILNHNKIKIGTGLPNLAVPYEYNRDDGIKFSKIMRNLDEIEKENKKNKIFKYYSKIKMFSKNCGLEISDSIYVCGGSCGTGRAHMGLLPNNMLSGCHRSFVDFCENYKKIASEKTDNKIISNSIFSEHPNSVFMFPEAKFNNYAKRINLLYQKNSCAYISTQAIIIQQLAIAGQIQEKYKCLSNAVKAARLLLVVASPCVRNNIATTGTLAMSHSGIFKLFLNGAGDTIFEELLMNE